MKVVHLVTIDYGGAYRAAVRISESMNQAGVDSSVLLRTKTLENSDAEEIFSSYFERFCSKVKNGLNLLFSFGEVVIDRFGTDITHYNKIKEADVVILHWVNSFVSPKGIEKLATLQKPILWVLHDMWEFTGGCHYDKECGKYHNLCGVCPQLKSKEERDRTRLALLRKRKAYSGKGIVYVGPSRWICECAEESTILHGEKIINIPNPLSEEVYYPMEKESARRMLAITSEKKLVVFGALKSTSSPYKGFSYLKEALQCLDRKQCEIVVFGNDDEDTTLFPGGKVHYLGVIHSEERLRAVYSAADVFVAPSLQDNYPSTVLEALACGTPVVAFSIGGMSDMIFHGENGYLAHRGDSADLAEGIQYCLAHRNDLSQQAVQSVRQNNSYSAIGQRYRALCERMMEGNIHGE